MSAVATQATVPDAPSSRRRALLPGLVLAVVALAAVAWMADFTRGVTFWSDDWGFIVDRRGWDGQALFGSHNGHLVAAHALVYKLLFELFGLGSVWPYKLVALGLHLLVVALLYVYALPRVSPAPAAVAAGLFVIFGSAAEVLAWQFHAGNLMAVSAGLGALLCLARRDRRGDRADPRFVPSAMVYGRPAGRILDAVDDLGSPYDGDPATPWRVRVQPASAAQRCGG